MKPKIIEWPQCLIDRENAPISELIATEELIEELKYQILDKVISLYVPDGNPEIWLQKIQQLKTK